MIHHKARKLPEDSAIAMSIETNDEETEYLNESKNDIKIGDVYSFGNYNGNTDWIVLDVVDDKALLLSKNAIEQRTYNNNFAYDITWENCDLRDWLNSEYIDNAFSEEESERIIQTQIINADSAKFGTRGGNDTMDKVFLLSIDEVCKYLKTDADRKAYYDDGTSAWWWLRSPGNSSYYASYVVSDGSVNEFGISVSDVYGAVRPAMWIEISNP